LSLALLLLLAIILLLLLLAIVLLLLFLAIALLLLLLILAVAFLLLLLLTICPKLLHPLGIELRFGVSYRSHAQLRADKLPGALHRPLLKLHALSSDSR